MQVEMSHTPSSAAIAGRWRSRGYGWVLDVHQAGYAFYDRTALGIVLTEAGGSEEFGQAFDRVAQAEGRLSLYARGEITRYDFDRVATLPGPVLHGVADPELTFEYFWRVFEQDYVFFRLHDVDVDWHAMYQRYRPQVSPATSPGQLFEVLCAMIAPLRDNHVALHGDDRHFVSDRIAGLKALMVRELELDSPSLGLASTVERCQRVVASRFLRGRAQTAANRLMTWGWLAPGVGYLNILRFFGFADSPQTRAWEDLPEQRSTAAQLLAADLVAADEVMTRVFSDLSAASALVVDVRINGGGFDRLALHIARWFCDRERVALSKCARWGGGLTDLQPIEIAPPTGNTPFTKPVYLLTGERTASAAEVFALGMRCQPHVTSVGSATLGILSDNLRKRLPNGWTVTISNELYSAPDGSIPERIGLAPDVPTIVFDPHDFLGGLDVAITTAVRLAMTR
jgi:carboxyl-terminal processing protease